MTPTMRHGLASYMPWTDRGGRFSAFKAIVFAATLLPAIILAFNAITDGLGAKPVMAAIHETGDWTVRFLLAALFVTPLRRILAAPKIATVRRMLGLAALAYALPHLVLYGVELNGDILRVVTEIALRIYLTIGFVALVGLCVLGWTSTDGAIRRMGAAWGRLHRIAYPLTALGLLHFFLQSKINVDEPTIMAGLFMLLLAYRAGFALNLPVARPVGLAVVAVLAGLATVAIEYAWYGLATGIPPERVVAANLLFPDMIRPAWWVLISGLAVAALPPVAWVVRRVEARFARPTTPRPRRVRASIPAEG